MIFVFNPQHMKMIWFYYHVRNRTFVFSSSFCPKYNPYTFNVLNGVNINFYNDYRTIKTYDYNL